MATISRAVFRLPGNILCSLPPPLPACADSAERAHLLAQVSFTFAVRPTDRLPSARASLDQEHGLPRPGPNRLGSKHASTGALSSMNRPGSLHASSGALSAMGWSVASNDAASPRSDVSIDSGAGAGEGGAGREALPDAVALMAGSIKVRWHGGGWGRRCRLKAVVLILLQ